MTGFGLEAKDAYYFELLAIMSEYSNYLTWMKDLHNKLHENLIHAWQQNLCIKFVFIVFNIIIIEKFWMFFFIEIEENK